MKSFKTAVKIWKKEIAFKFNTWGIQEERENYRKQRQDAIRIQRSIMREDLLNRHRIGDIILEKDEKLLLEEMRYSPVFAKIEAIYKKYL